MRLRLVVAVLALVLIAAPTLTAAPGPRGTLTGQVTFVRDGDTIVVGSMPIRLNGLAAPEWDEPGGDAAMDAMIKLVAGRTLRCELNGERTHDRCVGVCYLQGVDISAEMVHRGVARNCPRFSGGRYHVIEAQAAADETTSIGDVLGLAPNSLIHDRRFRDHLEHYYDWLQKLAKKVGKSPVAIHTIGPRHMIRVENVVLISHYDPGHCIFTFMGDDFDLASMNAEANRIEEIADQWINDRVDRDRDRARRRHGEPPR